MEQLNENELRDMRTDITNMKAKVDKMYYALMGNEIGKDGGLVGRIEELEVVTEKHDKSIQDLKDTNVKVLVYQKIMWTAIGFAAAALFSVLLSNIHFVK